MFKYFGSKYRLVDVYPPPRYGTIVEPFAGSAAYAVRWGQGRRVVLIERDERVVALWQRLLAMPAAAIGELRCPDPGDLSDDLLVAFAAGRTTRDTPSTFTVSPRMAQRFAPMCARIARSIDACRHFEVIHGDYTVAPDEEATWFIDPPYQPAEGRWDRTRGGRYEHSNRDIDYAALAAWTLSRRGQVVACDQHGATWLPWKHTVSARTATHAKYNEVWWTNDDATLFA